MPIKLPDLDDRTYADLVAEAISSIPSTNPAWTDHNASNPGIALVELLAWLTEMVLYRTNQVPEKSYDVFLRLLNGPSYQRAAGQDLQSAIHETVAALRARYRAVTAEDYEALTREVWPGSPEAKALDLSQTINRVHCLPERNLDAQNKLSPAPGHVSLILVPKPPAGGTPWNQPSSKLCTALKDFFKDRKLITTRLHVSGPAYIAISATATIYLNDDADDKVVAERAKAALDRCFHPCAGRPDQPGWPLGRDARVADVFTALENVSGVDFVNKVSIAAVPEQIARKITEGTEVVALKLDPHELPSLTSTNLTFMERRGNEWRPINA